MDVDLAARTGRIVAQAKGAVQLLPMAERARVSDTDLDHAVGAKPGGASVQLAQRKQRDGTTGLIKVSY